MHSYFGMKEHVRKTPVSTLRQTIPQQGKCGVPRDDEYYAACVGLLANQGCAHHEKRVQRSPCTLRANRPAYNDHLGEPSCS